MVQKLEGYLLIPHELLHVAAHRLIGKQCSYRLGESYVSHIDHCTRREYLFCLLFPAMISLPLSLLPLALWISTFRWYSLSTSQYLETAPIWHICLFGLWFALFTYAASSCFYDIWLAIRLLFQKLGHQPPYNASKQ